MLDGVVTWAEIDLDAIAFNVSQFRQHVGKRVEIIAVVKADAYGHGATPVARAVLAAGASRLAVHRLHEGIALRQAGIDAPLLVMSYTPPEGAELAASHHLTPTLATVEFARALSGRAQALGVHTPVHIKIDTGMNRSGLAPEELLDFLQAIHDLPGIQLEGLYTHFSTADWSDPTHTLEQLAVFQELVETARQAGYDFPMLHAANSAATMRLPEAHLDAVRPGIALYGLHPSTEWPPPFEIRPALALKSMVSRLRMLPEGACVGYGRAFVAQRPTLAALAPVGYGDGYHRNLSTQARVLVGGQRAALIGRISMDQIVVDVTGIPGVALGDEVVLIGAQGGDRISAEELAGWAGTINYEVTTALLPRVTRIYRGDYFSFPASLK